jgi:hypothetical protein
MSSPYNSTSSASSHRDSHPRRQPTDATSGSHAQQTRSSRQSPNIVPASAGPSSANTDLPAYSQDSGSPPTYRKLTQTQELVESLQSQVSGCTQEGSSKADASKSNRKFGSRKQLAGDAVLQRSMAGFGRESLNYMHSGAVSHLGAAHNHLKSIVEGKPSVTEANEEFCKLRTDAFLVAALPSVKKPDLFTWEVDNRIESPYREARRFWTSGLDSKSQRPIAKIKMSS